MRVVADTNVLISALMFAGVPGQFLDLALGGAFTLVTSKPLLDELGEKLCGKFSVSLNTTQKALDDLRHKGEVVHPDFELDAVPEDPDDNRVLECAIAGQVDFIVSGDKHLLRLASYESVPILTVRQFLETAGFPTQ
jgi:putative PIN family toxin of toxin-antitoxin system